MLTLVAGTASADDSSKSATRASALFEEGRRLMAAENYAAACPKLAESLALVRAADTAFDLGICYQKASQAAFMVAHELAQVPDKFEAPISPAGTAIPEERGASAGKTQRTVGLVIGGAGVVGLVTATITALMAKSAFDSASSCDSIGSSACASSQIDQSRSAVHLGNISTISFLTGVAAVGAGTVVFLTAPKSRSGEGTAVGVAPAAAGAGLSIAGRF